MPYIHHQLNGASIGYYQLDESLTVGRNPDNHLVIDDSTVSGQHAVIEVTPEGGLIRDLGSTNGVFVNGKRVTESLLKEGDGILIGTHDLELVAQVSEALNKTLKIKKSWIPGVYYTPD